LTSEEVLPMEASAIREKEGKNPGLNKYLTFTLGEEEYGLDILMVKEIIGMLDITRVPRLPDFVLGVINLRGKIIPVVDLRRKFGLEPQEDTKETCIIVVDLGRTLMGMRVDRVSEVLDLAPEDIEDTPSFGAEVQTDFITGMGKAGERVIMLLDISRVLTGEELEAVSGCYRQEG
jgi:purine-binding chemotaxis protein CheW